MKFKKHEISALQIKGDVRQASAKKNLMGTAIIAAFATPAFGVIYWFEGFPAASLAILAIGIFYLALITWFRSSENVPVTRELMVVSINILILWIIYKQGGFYSPNLAWLLLPPFMSIFLGSIISGAIWTVINIACLSAFYILTTLNISLDITKLYNPLLVEYYSIAGLIIVLTFFAYIIEINKRQSLNKLESLAFQDSLTGLNNRYAFEILFEKMLKEADKNNQSLFQLYLDVDNFKTINDTYGHRAGDQLLIELASRINKLLNDSSLFARIGGDEFLIILKNMSMEEIKGFIETFYKSIRQSIQFENHEVIPSLSIGIAIYPKNGKSALELMRNSDIALYQAKKSGKNNYHIYQAEEGILFGRKSQIELALPSALKNGEFEIFYQPQFMATQPNILVGMEALLRWNSKSLGQVSPAEFIPIAEKMRLIIKIDEFVLQHALHQYHIWQTKHLDMKLKLAVNISSESFRQYKLIYHLKKLLTELHIEPAQIELEITESMILQYGNDAEVILNSISELGVGLAIDDFGTGYSALSYLQKLPFTTIKIDKAFIADITNINSNTIIIQAIINLAKSLHLRTVAEGIETPMQLSTMQKFNCDILQGFLLSVPLDAKNFEALISQNQQQDINT